MERVIVSDVAQIYELWKKYAAAINAGDMERWIALWSDGGIQMPPNAPLRSGKEQIQAKVQSLVDLSDIQLFINPEEVRILGNQAYSHGYFSSEVIPKEGGVTTEICGKFLTILEKQTDGFWKILIECFNYDRSKE